MTCGEGDSARCRCRSAAANAPLRPLRGSWTCWRSSATPASGCRPLCQLVTAVVRSMAWWSSGGSKGTSRVRRPTGTWSPTNLFGYIAKPKVTINDQAA